MAISDPDTRIRRHIANLGNMDMTVVMRAERYLIRYGARAIDLLIAATRNDNPRVRLYAGWVLGKIGDHRASGAIVSLLNDPQPDVRYDAAIALGYLGDQRAIAPLARLIDLAEADGPLASAAANGLEKFGAFAIPSMIAVLKNGSAGARSIAAYVLGKVGNESVIPELTASSDDPDVSVRIAGKEALEAMQERGVI